MCRKKEEHEMAIPANRLEHKLEDVKRKELIRQSSKKISEKYDKTLRLLSKN